MARPSPFRRPALLRISESDMCPRITATIAAGSKKKKKPRIRLAIALPSVCGTTAPVGIGGAPGAETALPQTLQKRLPSAKVFPHLGQNTIHPSSGRKEPGTASVRQIARHITPAIPSRQLPWSGLYRFANPFRGRAEPRAQVKFALARRFLLMSARENTAIPAR